MKPIRDTENRISTTGVALTWMAYLCSAATALSVAASPDPSLDLQQDNSRQADNSELQTGGKQWSVVFEDVSEHEPTEEFVKAVLQDLNVVYGRLERHRIIPLKKNQTVVVKEQGLTVSAIVDFSRSEGYYIPEVLAKNFGLIVPREDGADAFVLTEEVRRAYHRALDFKRQHQTTFIKLEKFVRLLNERPEEISALGVDRVFYFGHLSEQEKRKLKRGSNGAEPLRQFRGRQWLRPSVLDVFVSQKEDEFRGLFVCRILTRAPDGKIDPLWLVYAEGVWRIAVVHGE